MQGRDLFLAEEPGGSPFCWQEGPTPACLALSHVGSGWPPAAQSPLHPHRLWVCHQVPHPRPVKGIAGGGGKGGRWGQAGHLRQVWVLRRQRRLWALSRGPATPQHLPRGRLEPHSSWSPFNAAPAVCGTHSRPWGVERKRDILKRPGNTNLRNMTRAQSQPTRANHEASGDGAEARTEVTIEVQGH